MQFFTDAAYSQAYDETHLYQVGEDTIYVEVDTTFHDDLYSVFDTSLLNVWICTFDPLYDVIEPDADTASGGCFDSERDGGFTTEDNKYFYHIYSVDGAIEEEGFVLIGHPDDQDVSKNRLQFYFVVPPKIARDKLYVHAQVEVTLTNDEDDGVKRLLLNAYKHRKDANQMDHFLGDVRVTRDAHPTDDNPINNEPQYPQQPQQIDVHSSGWSLSGSSVAWMIVLGGVLCAVGLYYMILKWYFATREQRNRLSFNRRRRSGYASVKDVDSDEFHDSEINVIDIS